MKRRTRRANGFLGVDELTDIQNLITKSEVSRPLGNLSVQEIIILK
jgi:hypothetical protein